VATILIVDDRSSNRQFLTTLLGYGGHLLIEAVNGAEALEMVRVKRPDLVITDILMPTMDGFEFVQKLRADPALLNTKVIFHTATYSESEAQKLAASCGVRTVLPKPCEPQQVFDAVEQELGVQPAVRAAFTSSKEATKPGGPPGVDETLSLRFKNLQTAQRKVERFVERSSRSERDQRLWQELSGNVVGLQRLASRLSALVEIALEMMQERDPTRLVKLFFGAACEMIDAEYTALCMFGEDGQSLQHVLARNFDPEVLRKEGAARAGLLGKLVGDRRALRAHGAKMASSAAGLPAGHPPVRSFLGVAIATRDQVYGWLYFADRREAEEFSEEDERVAGVLAAKLALLYENTQLYDVIQRHAAKLQVESAERMQAQHALREREAGLRRAQTMAGLAHVITGPDGGFESWSETLPVLIGVEPGRMPKSTREWLDILHPDDRAKFRDNSIEAGVAHARRDIGYRMRRADGAWIDVRQVIEPLEGQAGETRGGRWFNTLQDVTNQKRAAEALRTSEERFRAMFEKAAVGISQSEPGGRFIAVNPKFNEIIGYTQEEALSLSFRDLTHPDDVQQSIDSRSRLLAGTSPPYERETRLVRKDGTQLWVNVTTSLVRAADGEPLHFISVLHDVTERKAQRERITRLNRVYAVLSGINTLIVRVRDRDELFRETCRIAVQSGQFPLAFVAVVDSRDQLLRNVAWAGDERGFVHLTRPTVDAKEQGKAGLGAQAIQRRIPVVCNDIEADGSAMRYPKAALERGYRSAVALPLVVDGTGIGALLLFAAEAGFFDAEEMKLLHELASDIAFALEHLEALGKVEYLAFHDPLTGLPNRAVLTDRLGQILSTARRDKQLAGVMFFDVERFRMINDTLGRQAGDEFLKAVAERFKSAIRAQDTVARIGADVFAVAVASFANVTDATHLLSDRLAKAFAQPILVNGQELRAVLKAGIAVFPEDGDTAEALCRNAEAALKRAKDAGERYVFYTPEINARVSESLALENKLRRALEAEEFVLHYQPKVDTKTRAIVGLEALIRWNDPKLGLVPPGKFIPLMEETGIILQAGRWALRRAVTDVQAWREKGLLAPRVAVNVSQIQLRQKDFVQSVLEALAGFGDAEPVLDLEITESMVMQNFDATVRALQTLRGVGVETSLDDFGTGYSSLAYVARLPVAALKIDRSFVIEMVSSRYARTIVETVISLAHSLGLKVIAEGVDAEDQLALLSSLGCDQIQGYLISKPVPPEQVVAMLSKA
jgi:diguanylate cyclase (GGDEF)-like protein/PAS domain S-box-containing protein